MQTLVLGLISALGFGGWVLFARSAGADPWWTNVAVATTVLVVSIIVAAIKGPSGITGSQLLLLFGYAGILDAIAMVTYTMLIAAGAQEGCVIALVLAPVVMTVGGAYWFDDAFPPVRVVGLVAGLVCVFCMTVPVSKPQVAVDSTPAASAAK